MRRCYLLILFFLALISPALATTVVIDGYIYAAAGSDPDPTINNLTTATPGSNASSLTFSVTTTSLTNSVLIVCAGNEETGNGIPSSATFNGSAMTALNSSTVGTTVDSSSRLFYMLNPPATTANVVITYSTTVDNTMGSAIQVANLAQQAPTNETTTNQLTGTSSPITSTISATPSNGIVVDCITNGNVSNFTATGTGHVEQSESDGSSSTMSFGTNLFTSSGTKDITWTNSSVNRWAQTAAVFEKYTSEGGGGGLTDFADTTNGATLPGTTPNGSPVDTIYFGPDEYSLSMSTDGTWVAVGGIYSNNSELNTINCPTDDSNYSTWSVDGVHTSSSDPVYMVIDLGQERTFNTAYYFQAFSDGQFTDVRLDYSTTLRQYSDGGWTEAHDWIAGNENACSGDSGASTTFPDVTARYVRVGLYNDGSFTSDSYIEIQKIKLFYVE